VASPEPPSTADTKKSLGKNETLKAGTESAEKKSKTSKMAIISRLSKRSKVCCTNRNNIMQTNKTHATFGGKIFYNFFKNASWLVFI
jgi:hypothetical protein